MLKSLQLGRNTGLQVSKLCLGTMNFGEPGRGHQGDWTLGTEDARPIFEAAIEQGINYFDCADIYGVGASEIVVGQLLKELLPRDEYVLTTKVSMPMGRSPNQGGLSRKHIIEGVDRSLKRLGHDFLRDAGNLESQWQPRPPVAPQRNQDHQRRHPHRHRQPLPA